MYTHSCRRRPANVTQVCYPGVRSPDSSPSEWALMITEAFWSAWSLSVFGSKFSSKVGLVVES